MPSAHVQQNKATAAIISRATIFQHHQQIVAEYRATSVTCDAAQVHKQYMAKVSIKVIEFCQLYGRTNHPWRVNSSLYYMVMSTSKRCTIQNFSSVAWAGLDAVLDSTQ